MIGEGQLADEDFGEVFITSSGGQAMQNFLLNLPNLPQHSFSKTEYLGISKFDEFSGKARFENLGSMGSTI
jgi:hypothetical protein